MTELDLLSLRLAALLGGSLRSGPNALALTAAAFRTRFHEQFPCRTGQEVRQLSPVRVDVLSRALATVGPEPATDTELAAQVQGFVALTQRLELSQDDSDRLIAFLCAFHDALLGERHNLR